MNTFRGLSSGWNKEVLGACALTIYCAMHDVACHCTHACRCTHVIFQKHKLLWPCAD